MLDRPKVVIGLFLALTAVFALFIPGLKFDARIENMVPEDDPAIRDILEATEEFGSQDIFMIAIRSDNVFTAETLKKIDDMTKEISRVQGVAAATNFMNVNLIESGFFGIEITPAVDELPQTPAEIERFRERILNSSYAGQLVTEDGRAAAIMVSFEHFGDSQGVRLSEITGQIDKIAQKYRGPEEIYIVGNAYVSYYAENAMVNDMSILIPLVIVVVMIILYSSFRTGRGVALPLSVVLTSAILATGLMSMLDIPVTVVTMVMPVILIAIGSGECIHVINRYFEELSSGKDKRSALAATMKGITGPVAMAALTTAAGFASLVTSFVGPVRELGLFTAFGIIVAMCFSLLFVPAVLMLLPVPSHLSNSIDRSKRRGRLDSVLVAVGNFIARNPKTILAACGVILLICVIGSFDLSLESSFMNYFEKDSPIIKGTNIVEDEFGGSMQISLLFDTGRADGVKEPEVLNKMIEAQEYMNSLPGVSQASSVADLIRELNRALNEGREEFYVIPETRQAVAQELLLFEMQGGSGLDTMVTYNFDKAMVSARLKSMRSSELKGVVRKLEEYIDARFSSGEDPKVKIVGIPNVTLVLLERFRASQIYSLIASTVTVAIIVAIIMKSAIAGIISIIPLILTVGINFGVMGFSGIPLDAITTTIASVAVGVGIDYTIHYISRYRSEIADGKDQEKAIAVAASTTGRGIFFNAVTVALGFGILVVSSFRAIDVFGFLVALTMVTSSLAALTLVPAILRLIRPEVLMPKSTAKSASLAVRP